MKSYKTKPSQSVSQTPAVDLYLRKTGISSCCYNKIIPLLLFDPGTRVSQFNMIQVRTGIAVVSALVQHCSYLPATRVKHYFKVPGTEYNSFLL